MEKGEGGINSGRSLYLSGQMCGPGVAKLNDTMVPSGSSQPSDGGGPTGSIFLTSKNNSGADEGD